ncbi:MAG: hypothetical protein V1820_01815 [archaeon]
MVKGKLFGFVLAAFFLSALFLSIILSTGFSWNCHCSSPGANNGCGGGCSFNGVTCGPGEIQWCNPLGPCKPLSQSGYCYTACKELLKTGGTCICGNYVWPTTTTTATTIPSCISCQTTTSTTAPYCNGADIETDESNCGACGHACPTGYYCSSGMCVSDIPGTSIDCYGIDLKNSRENCGACGHACPTGYYCSSGFCMTDTPTEACTPGNVFEDTFSVGVPNGWSFDQSGGRAEFSESSSYLFLSSNGLDNDFPLVGRSNAFSGIGSKYYVEIRFQYPQVRERSSGIFIGTFSPFSAATRMPDNVGAFDREDFLSVKSDTVTGLLNVTAFGEPVYSGSYDLNWHVIRMESISGQYKIYFDGVMYSAGTSTAAPKTIWFGNYTYYTTTADWSSLRVDYVKVGNFCESVCSGNFNSDSFNCGFCGHVCPTDFKCSKGFCVAKETYDVGTATTSTTYGCLTPAQWGRREICCDGADNDNDGLIDAQDPSCSTDQFFNGGDTETCYGTEHPYRTKIQTDSGYFSCPNGTTKMRFYLKLSAESGDKLLVYDGTAGNRLIGVVEKNFNGGQYGWTEYYPTWKSKLLFNSDPVAANYGFDVARVDCYNGHTEGTPVCESYYCSLRSGGYCNGPAAEQRSYFCSEGVCKYSVTGTSETSGSCGVYGMTVETDKYFYAPGEEIRVRGTVNNKACPSETSADTFVEVRTTFGKWTTYTDFTGSYYLTIYNSPEGSHEISAKAMASATGPVTAYASKWFILEPNNLKVTVQAVPMTVLAGETSIISGKVSDGTLPVRSATVELRMPWGKEILTTNTFGEFSKEIWTTSWYGNNNITAHAQKEDKVGWASAILTVNPSGNGNEDFTLEAPAIVKPNSLFSAEGKWFVGGIPASEPFIVTYRATRKTAAPSDGIYDVSLLSPSSESCDLVSARNMSVQVCTRIHDSMGLSIGYGSGEISFVGTYEDGTSANGSLAYAIDSGRYVYERMDNGFFKVPKELSPGTHTIWANLNDGRLFASDSEQVTIGGGVETSTTSPGQTTTVPVENAPKITASAPEMIEVYKFEEALFSVTVKNEGTAEGQALVKFGDESGTARVSPGSSAEVSFTVIGTEDRTVPLEVTDLGKRVLKKDVSVDVLPFQIIWPRVVFYKGPVSIPYILLGRTTNALVNDSLQDSNGTVSVSSSATSDLPTNGTISANLQSGEYLACANLTNWKGNLLSSECEEIIVKDGLGVGTWFIVAIGAAALLLLFF